MKKKTKEPKNVWQYVDWLEHTNRLTTEEHLKLVSFIAQLEAEALQCVRPY